MDQLYDRLEENTMNFCLFSITVVFAMAVSGCGGALEGPPLTVSLLGDKNMRGFYAIKQVGALGKARQEGKARLVEIPLSGRIIETDLAWAFNEWHELRVVTNAGQLLYEAEKSSADNNAMGIHELTATSDGYIIVLIGTIEDRDRYRSENNFDVDSLNKLFGFE